MTDATILSVDELTIRFGAVTAVDGVSLGVAPGERVALLGHNGAGKSTLFKTVLGFLKPAAGRLSIGGAAPGSDAARRAVSYLPEQVVFPKALTGAEVLTHFARLKGVAPKTALPLLETVGIADAAGRAAAERILGLVSGLTEDDLVICLASGGGSAPAGLKGSSEFAGCAESGRRAGRNV